MVRQACIPLSAPNEWRDALEGLRHGIAHTWEYVRAIQLSTGWATYLYRFDDGDTRIVCPIAERPYQGHLDIVTPYGFSGFVGTGERPDFSRRWAEFTRSRGYVCGFIGLSPLFHNRTYAPPEEVEDYNEVYVLALTQDLDRLRALLSTNRRRQLKDWETLRQGLVDDRAALAAFFLDHYVDFFRTRGATGAYAFSRDSLATLLELDRVLMVGVSEGGRVQAVSVFGYTPHAGDFLFNVSVPEGRRHSVALLWWGVEHLKSLGVPLLNLGGGVRRGDRLAEFKQRFGGLRLPLGCLKQVYRPDVYAELCRGTGVDPVSREGFFPPYRRAGAAEVASASDAGADRSPAPSG